MQFGTDLQRAASCLARHTWTYGASVSHAHTPNTHGRLNRKATYDRCRMNHHRTSWCSRRWSPPTAGDTPPDGSMTPPYRWYWVLWAPPQRKITFVSIFWLIIHSFNCLFFFLADPTKILCLALFNLKTILLTTPLALHKIKCADIKSGSVRRLHS